MVPAAVVDASINDLLPLLEPDDILIDGGNSHYVDDIRRAKELAAKGIHYVDVGTSGGVWGLERGYCMMIGGEPAIVKHLDPLFVTLAPGIGDIPRTPGRERANGTAEQGYLHCGPNGAGHFVKMVHNGIEYGLMAAYAEGMGILRAANVGKETHAIDAETTPLRDPAHYQYDINLGDVAEVWRRGSVIASWLLDLTAIALLEDPSLSKFAGRVSDSGEGRWTIMAAIDEAVPAPVLTAALYAAFQLARRSGLPEPAALGDALSVRRTRGESPRSHRLRTGDRRWATHTPTRWCSSGRRAIWPTRRSSRRCRRWPSAATSMCRSSAWPRPAGPSTSCARGRRRASRSTAAWTVPRSPKLCGLLRYVDGDYKDPATFEALRRELGGAEHPAHYLAIPPAALRTRRRATGAIGVRDRAPASSSRSPSARTSPRRAT